MFTESRRRAPRAFTLVEMMVTIALGSIVLAAVGSLSLYTGRSFATLTNYVDLDNMSRNALDVFTRDVRQVRWVESFSRTNVVLQDGDGLPLRFDYDARAKTFSRRKADRPAEILLTECDELVFQMYQRNVVPGQWDLILNGNPIKCKAVSVTWTCSRMLFGKSVNTESVQTALIVIRKKED